MPSLDLIRYLGKGPVGRKTRRARGQFQEPESRSQEVLDPGKHLVSKVITTSVTNG